MLSKIKSKFLGISEKVFSKFRKIDLNKISTLEESFIEADFGVQVTDELLETIKQAKPKDIGSFIKNYILEILSKAQSDLLARNFEDSPYVILVIGVNGNGKTTTIAKLANHFKQRNLSVRVAAGDTFRAAATEQLAAWIKKIGCDITIGNEKSDPASVAYRAYEQAKAFSNNVLIVDTAGRLHTRNDLMNELLKIKNVIKKQNPNAPHEVVLVLDGLTGQNAFTQIEKFSSIVGVDSVIMTKMDSTAKGGAIVGIVKNYNLPISGICFGEEISDICEFSKEKYIASIFGET